MKKKEAVRMLNAVEGVVARHASGCWCVRVVTEWHGHPVELTDSTDLIYFVAETYFELGLPLAGVPSAQADALRRAGLSERRVAERVEGGWVQQQLVAA